MSDDENEGSPSFGGDRDGVHGYPTDYDGKKRTHINRNVNQQMKVGGGIQPKRRLETIIGALPDQGKGVTYIVRLSGVPENVCILSEDMRKLYPQQLLDYLENKICLLPN